jgi:glycosyltransferase involved in cell wall biosynthesis
MSECKLSILVPFYNVGEFVKPLLDCFEKLTLPEEDYEIIFWNDGSTDQSVDYVKAFLGAKKNRFLYSSSNLGIYPARNKLLNVAKGDYIWFVDADDLLEPSKV